MKNLILLVALFASMDASAARFRSYQYQTGNDNLQSQPPKSLGYRGHASGGGYVAPVVPVSTVKTFTINSEIRSLFQGCNATAEAQIPAQQVLAYVEGPGLARGACIPFYCDADLNNNNILDVDELANRSVYTRVESCDATHSTAAGYSLTGINAEAACIATPQTVAISLPVIERVTVWVEDFSITGSGTIRTGNCYWNTVSNQQAVFESSRLVCTRTDSVTLPGSTQPVEICRRYEPTQATEAVAVAQNEHQTGGADGLIDGNVDIDCANAYATAFAIGIYSDEGRKAFAEASRAQGHFQFTPREGVAGDTCSAQIDAQAAHVLEILCTNYPTNPRCPQ